MIVFENVGGFSDHSTLRNNVTDQTLLVTKHFIRLQTPFTIIKSIAQLAFHPIKKNVQRSGPPKYT